MRRVSLHRDARCVLDDISWQIAAGERWVLMGPNGSGKTQLLKLIAGAVWPDPGPDAQRRYRGSRGKVLDLVEVLPRIAYLGPERQDRYERYGWNFTAVEVVGTGCTRSDIPQGALTTREHEAALDCLRQLGVARLATRRFLTLSYGERRLVLLARAVATRPDVLLLDETLGGLDAVHRARVLRWLDRDAHDIPSWILATHREEEIPSSATHLLSIDAGVVQAAGPIANVSTRAAAHPERVAPRRRRKSSRALPSRAAATPLVSFTNADVYLDYRRVLRDLCFALRAGECWVVHGANGAGKSTLLRTIYGDHSIALGGQLLRRGIVAGVPLAEFKRWCAFVAPHQQSDPPRHETVLQTIVSGLRATVGLDAPPTRGELVRARRAAATFGLTPMLERSFGSLSYGQARRTLFARAFVLQPRLLLLDEALGGIDPESRQVLRKRIDSFVAAGGAVVFSSHHTDEWPETTGFELELRRGRLHYRGALRARAR